MVKNSAFFFVLISEITRCICEMALANQWDNVRGGFGLEMEEVAKKCGCHVGVERGSSGIKQQIKLQNIALLDAWRRRK